MKNFARYLCTAKMTTSKKKTWSKSKQKVSPFSPILKRTEKFYDWNNFLSYNLYNSNGRAISQSDANLLSSMHSTILSIRALTRYTFVLAIASQQLKRNKKSIYLNNEFYGIYALPGNSRNSIASSYPNPCPNIA